MVTYSVAIAYCETTSYFGLIQIYYKRRCNSPDNEEDMIVKKWSIINLILKGIYLAERHILSSVRYEKYILKDDNNNIYLNSFCIDHMLIQIQLSCMRC